MDKKKVVLGMSGGVDSSVAAYLLKEQGYDVIGVTMQIWQDKNPDAVEVEGGCCSLSAVDDARMVAEKLDIPFYVMNFKEVFKDAVIDYFIDEYKKGRTPNPCIACNRYVKFEEFMRRAFTLDAYYVSTGHYAIIERDEKTGRYLLKKSNASEKDQTYALYNMTQEQLKHTLMPLGKYSSKDEIRAIAEDLGLVVSKKPDSQEICFVPDNNYGKFISENSDHRDLPGKFLDTEGNVVGKHHGISNYTVGQRKGLGLALGYPAYVVDIDLAKNIVTVGKNEDVFGKCLIADDLNLISIETLEGPMDIEAKVRYSAKESPAKLIPLGDGKVKVEFIEPVRAITPGQSVVFYDGDLVLGGATIIRKED